MIKILIISCSLQPQYTIILFNTLGGGEKKKKSHSEQAPAGMWARKGYYSITSESTINKSSPEMGGQMSAVLHTKLHRSTRQWLINFSTSDNHSNQAFTAARKRSQRREPSLSLARKHGLAVRAESWDTQVCILPPLIIFWCTMWMVSKEQCLWPSSPRLGSTIPARHGKIGVSPAKGHKGWEYQAQKRLGLFSFQEEKGRENLIYVYQYLTGECKEDKDRFFSVVPTQRARGTKWYTGNAILTQRTYLLWEWSLLVQVAQRLSFLGDI